MITDYHYEWLPSQPWIWYEKYIKQNNKDDEVSTINYNKTTKRIIILNLL